MLGIYLLPESHTSTNSQIDPLALTYRKEMVSFALEKKNHKPVSQVCNLFQLSKMRRPDYSPSNATRIVYDIVNNYCLIYWVAIDGPQI